MRRRSGESRRGVMTIDCAPAATHVFTLGLLVLFAHQPAVCYGVLGLFLGVVTATKEYQDDRKLREGLLVGFFRSGLVTLGSLQAYWLKPRIRGEASTKSTIGNDRALP